MLEHLAAWITTVISTLGYPGIFFMMAVESVLIPLPSEVVMPFSGFLVSTGRFTLPLVVLSGAMGNVLGSLVSYALGYYGHEKVIRRFIRRYGKWLLISETDLNQTEKLLNRYNGRVVLFGRVVPGVRTFISLPCGFAKLPLARFVLLTFIGSLAWSFFLAWVGFILGANWRQIGPVFHKLDALVVAAVVLGAGIYVSNKLRKKH